MDPNGSCSPPSAAPRRPYSYHPMPYPEWYGPNSASNAHPFSPQPPSQFGGGQGSWYNGANPERQWSAFNWADHSTSNTYGPPPLHSPHTESNNDNSLGHGQFTTTGNANNSVNRPTRESAPRDHRHILQANTVSVPSSRSSNDVANSQSYPYGQAGVSQAQSHLVAPRQRRAEGSTPMVNSSTPYRYVTLASAQDRQLDTDEDEDDIARELLVRRTALLRHNLTNSDARQDSTIMARMRSLLKEEKRTILDRFEKVNTDTLADDDKCCMICYCTLGTENPEGLLEHAVQWPVCKHVFGEKCIQTWLDKNESCPYCRQKLHNEESWTARYAELARRYQREQLSSPWDVSTFGYADMDRHGLGSFSARQRNALAATARNLPHTHQQYASASAMSENSPSLDEFVIQQNNRLARDASHRRPIRPRTSTGRQIPFGSVRTNQPQLFGQRTNIADTSTLSQSSLTAGVNNNTSTSSLRSIGPAPSGSSSTHQSLPQFSESSYTSSNLRSRNEALPMPTFGSDGVDASNSNLADLMPGYSTYLQNAYGLMDHASILGDTQQRSGQNSWENDRASSNRPTAGSGENLGSRSLQGRAEYGTRGAAGPRRAEQQELDTLRLEFFEGLDGSAMAQGRDQTH